MHGLDVLVQVGDGERLAAVRAFRALVVVDLADVTRQVGHGKLFVAMRTGLLDLNKQYINSGVNNNFINH